MQKEKELKVDKGNIPAEKLRWVAEKGARLGPKQSHLALDYTSYSKQVDAAGTARALQRSGLESALSSKDAANELFQTPSTQGLILQNAESSQCLFVSGVGLLLYVYVKKKKRNKEFSPKENWKDRSLHCRNTLEEIPQYKYDIYN